MTPCNVDLPSMEIHFCRADIERIPLGVRVEDDGEQIVVGAFEDNPVVKMHADWSDDEVEGVPGSGTYHLTGDLANGTGVVFFITEEAFVGLHYAMAEHYKSLAHHRRRFARPDVND